VEWISRHPAWPSLVSLKGEFVMHHLGEGKGERIERLRIIRHN
jgi:hypothetical protein